MAAEKKSKGLTVEKSIADFKKAYNAKRALLDIEHEDFLFALGKQWTEEDLRTYEERKIKPVTDNRIQPNIFLITGLERQNRSEFKAYPRGQEDSLKAEVASYLFKDSIDKSDFLYKTSEQFKDGITCGESHLELWLDNTEDLLNGTPNWRKADGNTIFPEPDFREYDYSDARYVYKLTKDISVDDLIALFPEKKKLIQDGDPGHYSYETDAFGKHIQPRDYKAKSDQGDDGEAPAEDTCDLLERYYKKYIDKDYIGDKANGTIQEAENAGKAKEFINQYQAQIQQDAAQYQQDLAAHQAATDAWNANGQPVGQMPIPPVQPPEHDPNRFLHFTRHVPEIWVYAHVAGINEPLADERAWFYPLWKKYPFIPFYARFSTAPLKGEDRALLVQGIVRPVKNAQQIHNKTKTLELLHLNTSTNSGWLIEEDTWTNPDFIKEFGATPGVNAEYKKGKPVPTRIFPQPLSTAHESISQGAAESIKQQLGINSDLIAAEEGSSQSGRAIALRQKQGLLMVQELFDNLSRSRTLAGKMLLSQMGKMYDIETAKKVLGEQFIQDNFSVPVMQTIVDPRTGQQVQAPKINPQTGQTVTQVDEQSLDQLLTEVLSGEIGTYDVAVGEAVSSETMRMANMADLKDFATMYPGAVPADLLVEESMLPQSTKTKVVNSIKQAQAMAAMMPRKPAGGQNGGK